MKRFFTYGTAVVIPVLFLGCISPTISREVSSGRRALRLENPTDAARHFESASRMDPGYVTGFTPLNVGIWTYLGRAYYESGQNEKALESLKRAKSTHGNDYLARVYLGLVLSSQNGSRTQGVQELQTGLEGLAHWLRDLPGTGREGKFWDPGNYIANNISQTRAMLQGEQPDWQAVRANVLRLGRELEEEILEVQQEMDHDKRQTEN